MALRYRIGNLLLWASKLSCVYFHATAGFEYYLHLIWTKQALHLGKFPPIGICITTITLNMIQIKLFRKKTPNLDEFEKLVNDYIAENAKLIRVVDIKYSSETVNPGNPVWSIWSAMVIYEAPE